MADRLAAVRIDLMLDLQEDSCGLWEVLWRIDRLYPDDPPDVRIAMARALMLDLVRSGQCAVVDVPHLTWLTNDQAGVVINGDVWAREHPDTDYWLSLLAPAGG